jgi:hypothetical protein
MTRKNRVSNRLFLLPEGPKDRLFFGEDRYILCFSFSLLIWLLRKPGASADSAGIDRPVLFILFAEIGF